MPPKKNLHDDQRHQIVCTLLENSKQLKPKYGLIKELCGKFGVDRKTISNIWRKAKQQRIAQIPINVASKMKGKKGRIAIEVPYAKIELVDKLRRTTLKKLSFAIQIPYSTIQRWAKKGFLKNHTNAIKPALSPDHKYLRLSFVMSKLFFDQLLKCVKFRDMGKEVHIDEKWFYITKVHQRFYLVPGEEPPHRTCQSKRHITKVMFMAVVARPEYDMDGECNFDGKLGIFPFAYKQPAQRSSVNRPAGTMVTKCIEKITKKVTKEMLINKVLPAIKRKWPAHKSTTINIQQDNAPPHIRGDDIDFVAAATSDGWNITLNQQPANSPDLNILDLGFFRSIMSLQEEKPAKSIEQLIQNVRTAFRELDPGTLDNVWLSLQGIMLEIMKKRGHNSYTLPHLKKASLERQCLLPRDLTANEDLVRECVQFLITVGKTCNLSELIIDLGIPFPITMAV